MTGLIYKDFLALKGHLTTYLVFFLVYGGLCLSGVFTASVLCGMVVLMSLITPMTTVTSDDVSRWNRFAIATPACRRGVVTGKYLFTLLVTLASTVFVSLLLVVLALAGGLEEPLSELLLSALACAGIALIMNAVALPLLLKFGAEKARMVSMALFLLVFAGFALLGLAADRGLALPAPPAWVLTALPGLLAILAVGGFALSYCIAQAIYARKEFYAWPDCSTRTGCCSGGSFGTMPSCWGFIWRSLPPECWTPLFCAAWRFSTAPFSPPPASAMTRLCTGSGTPPPPRRIARTVDVSTCRPVVWSPPQRRISSSSPP